MAAKKCIVIGAGLAGLAAAHRASQRGWVVEVLEADSRYGGRVVTEIHKPRSGPPLIYELGGEWIGTHHKELIKLCEEFKLDRMDHQYAFGFWDPNKPKRFERFPAGRFPFPPHLEKKFKDLMSQVRNQQNDDCKNKELDRIDWWTKLKEIGFNDEELERRDLMDSTDFGESIRHTSAYAGAGEYASSDKFDEMDTKIRTGNSSLSDALVASILERGGAVCLNQRVTRIVQKNGVVQVTAGTRPPMTADACICAIPAPGLNKIDWDPLLPAEQSQAAEQLQYARIVKTAVLFSERFWKNALPHPRKAGFSMFSSRVSDFCFESTFQQDGKEGIICSYAVGDKADDIANEKPKDLADWIAGDLHLALGGPKVHGTFLKQKAWQKEPHIGGAYAFYRPGQFDVLSTLARPHMRVLFAGEHISDSWQGFMEGAIETGQAAADAL